MRSVIKKFLCILLVALIAVSGIYANSLSLNTSILGITAGLNDFGQGFFPLSTRWYYSKAVKLFPQLPRTASVSVDTDFALNYGSTDGRFAWDTGKPIWNWYRRDLPDEEYRASYLGALYFNPRSRLTFTLSQGFGTNKAYGYGPEISVDVRYRTIYAMALERPDLAPSLGNLIFVDQNGNPKAPFGPGSVIPGQPWLQDSRIIWNNALEFNFDYYNFVPLGLDALTGVTVNLHFEMGPHWMANCFFNEGVTSDYWKASTYIVEHLNLVNIKQENGWNWFSLNFGHSNYLAYTGGDVIPEYAMPSDRFRGSLADSFWLEMGGPHFLTGDSYTELKISLNNSIYMGHVVNEVSQESFGAELRSSVDAYFHLRLFGCLNFDFVFGYDFARGIWESAPAFYQSAAIRFFVTL